MQVVVGLLQARELVVQAPDVVAKAVRLVSDDGTEFSDAVISLLGAEAECEYTVTFDPRTSTLPGMRLLHSPGNP